jgi:hypothetical protein
MVSWQHLRNFTFFFAKRLEFIAIDSHLDSPDIATILACQSPETLKTPAVQTATPIIAGSAVLPETPVAETDGDGIRPSFTLKPNATVVFHEHFRRL